MKSSGGEKINKHVNDSLFLLIFRADSRFVPSQWETVLPCNNVSHWLGASLEIRISPDFDSSIMPEISLRACQIICWIKDALICMWKYLTDSNLSYGISIVNVLETPQYSSLEISYCYLVYHVMWNIFSKCFLFLKENDHDFSCYRAINLQAPLWEEASGNYCLWQLDIFVHCDRSHLVTLLLAIDLYMPVILYPYVRKQEACWPMESRCNFSTLALKLQPICPNPFMYRYPICK